MKHQVRIVRRCGGWWWTLAGVPFSPVSGIKIDAIMTYLWSIGKPESPPLFMPSETRMVQ